MRGHRTVNSKGCIGRIFQYHLSSIPNKTNDYTMTTIRIATNTMDRWIATSTMDSNKYYARGSRGHWLETSTLSAFFKLMVQKVAKSTLVLPKETRVALIHHRSSQLSSSFTSLKSTWRSQVAFLVGTSKAETRLKFWVFWIYRNWPRGYYKKF